jgi:hypothetical protein
MPDKEIFEYIFAVKSKIGGRNEAKLYKDNT